MQLRELTTEEIEDFNNIIYDASSIDTFQILYGMITLDLLEKLEDNKLISYKFICDNFTGDYPKYGPAAHHGIIETWVVNCMTYNNKEIHGLNLNSKGLKSSLRVLTAGLLYTVCHISEGVHEKKQARMHSFYEEINNELLRTKGHKMSECPFETFQFIVTCLDYLGFQRKIKYNKSGKVNVSRISYMDIT